jgi:PhnB protein
MATMSPYLNFLGNTEEAFNFYKSVFGGEFSVVQRFIDTPFGSEMPEGDRNKIMHIALPIAPGYVLMATDALESAGHSLTVGNNVYIAISPDSEAEADEIFNGLKNGATIEMELGKTFWGAYYGSLTDKFGVRWMVNYECPKE